MKFSDKEIKEELLRRLKQIKRFRKLRTHGGICNAIKNADVNFHYHVNVRINEHRDRLFILWPKFSGRIAYPVPTTFGGHPAHAFEEACFYWSRILPYGRRRWQLLNFMIKTLETELGRGYEWAR